MKFTEFLNEVKITKEHSLKYLKLIKKYLGSKNMSTNFDDGILEVIYDNISIYFKYGYLIGFKDENGDYREVSIHLKSIKDMKISSDLEQAFGKKVSSPTGMSIKNKKVHTYFPETNSELKELVGKLVKERGDNADLNDIDVSKITNFRNTFYKTRSFNGDISKWDTSNAIDMSDMFSGCTEFNQPVNFDTSKVTNMTYMFRKCEKFNQPVNFDTSNVTEMHGMFHGCENFNQPVNFNTSNVTEMHGMFSGCINFNQPIKIDTSKVTSMFGMFRGCEKFNHPVNFDTSKVTDMYYMFGWCTNFNQSVNFDTSKVTDMHYMFGWCTNFNQSVNFDTSKVENMGGMFYGCSRFNKDLSHLIVSKKCVVDQMFKYTQLDGKELEWYKGK